MTDHKELDALFDAFLAHLDGEGPEPDLSDLDDATRTDLQQQFDILRRDHNLFVHVPDLATDPVFSALGFDRENEEIDIVGTKVTSARKRLSLNLKDLFALFQNAGGTVDLKELFQIEQRTSTPLAQINATALAAALRVKLFELETTDGQVGRMRQFLASPDFEMRVQKLADDLNADTGTIGRQARDAMLATSYRGEEHVEFADLIALLEVVLEHIRDRWQH